MADITVEVISGDEITVVIADGVPLEMGDDRYVNADGDTMTGALNLSGDPSADNEATRKAYVDSEIDGDISTHAADDDAHHARYEDAEAVSAILAADGPGSTLDADTLDGTELATLQSEIDGDISTHAADDDAHHARYEDAEAVSAILAADGHGSGLDADTLDGTELATLQSEIDGDISTHAADDDAHHARYEDAEAVSAILAADGHGSGLDADTLDGSELSAIQSEIDGDISTHAGDDDAHHSRYEDAEAVAAILAADGPGSTLDADTLDGTELSAIQSEIDGDISTHAADDDAHHAKYTDTDAIAALNAAKMTFLNVRDPDAGDCVYIPPFTYNGNDYGGFLVQKYPASQPNATAYDDNPDAPDGASVGSTKAFSQPGVSPWREITSLEARKACANIGTGWHLITAFEWASLAYWAKANSTQPHGPNGDSNPPSDATYTTELGIRDYALAARGAYDSALTGSGPVTWAHNWRGDGVYGLNGVIWQWNDGLFLLPENLDDDSDTPHEITGAGEDGYCLILANREVSLQSAPYGASTSVAAGSLTDSNKDWTVNEFAGNWLYDADGDLYYIDSNTADTLSIDGADTPASGPYTIVRLKETDITSGMSSGNRILTLSSDSDLEPLAIPATSDGTGSATYGNDRYWFSTSALCEARRGGTWLHGVGAGAFALNLNNVPSKRNASIGFRACKSL